MFVSYFFELRINSSSLNSIKQSRCLSLSVFINRKSDKRGKYVYISCKYIVQNGQTVTVFCQKKKKKGAGL